MIARVEVVRVGLASMTRPRPVLVGWMSEVTVSGRALFLPPERVSVWSARRAREHIGGIGAEVRADEHRASMRRPVSPADRP